MLLNSRHGKPAGIPIGFKAEDDRFDYQLENDPKFLARIEQPRASIRRPPVGLRKSFLEGGGVGMGSGFGEFVPTTEGDLCSRESGHRAEGDKTTNSPSAAQYRGTSLKAQGRTQFAQRGLCGRNKTFYASLSESIQLMLWTCCACDAR